MDKRGVKIKGITSPDIEIDGVMWEIKSPQPSKAPAKEGSEIDFIEVQLKSACNRNFKNPFDYETGEAMGDCREQTRVVLSARYRDVSASEEDVDRHNPQPGGFRQVRKERSSGLMAMGK
ncbi:hypothetical protein HLV37_01375 [Eggerthellaceae bacterium zg-1084]|uniref:hypothetical protein n=1 Tax=Berryella wangjianweii TaxID=2734634 RepID=UPI0015573E68|nr:hypothetical protein [Berryella wangjianweii]NPD30533.1 hypothetical protein [Berryella wangjianweii]